MGVNSKHDTGKPFWDRYWSDFYGFDKDILLFDLRAENDGELSATRCNIEAIGASIREVIGTGTLDTNVYLAATKTAAELRSDQKKPSTVLTTLMDRVAPDVVLFHSIGAVRYFVEQGCSLTEEKMTIQESRCWNGRPFKAVVSPRQLGWIKGRSVDQLTDVLIQAFN